MNNKLFKKVKHIHFVGIKGVGMTPLAILARERGLKVSGCDIGEKFITDWALKKVGVEPLIGFSANHLKNVDLVITTGAHGGFDNPEVRKAQELKISIWAQGQAVGEFMKGKILGRKKLEGISVAGSHGKTTVTALLATVLTQNNLSPSYLVGTGSINQDWLPGHLGKGDRFITEADEYANEPKYDKTPKFLYQYPKMIIMTNIEFDHPDQFSSLDQVTKAFLKFAQNLPSGGVLVVNGDDLQIRRLLPKISAKVVTYGEGEDNDFILSRISQSEEKTYFWVRNKNLSLGEFWLSVPGSHNALNALAVVTACVELGVSISDIKKALPIFRGTRRRFEFVGEKDKVLFYDDYAHHPTEIKATLKMVKAIFPKKRIICIFQPHTSSRTQALWEEFIHAFSDASEIIVTDIYPSLRESQNPAITSTKLVVAMSKFHPQAKFFAKASDVVEYINQKIAQDKYQETVVLTMGAGDIYKINEKLKIKN